MTFEARVNRPCTIVHRTVTEERDDDGNEVIAETSTETVWYLEQTDRTEHEDRGELSETTWLALFLVGAVVGTADTILDGVDGLEYELIGDPWPVWHPKQRGVHHLEATVRRTGGAASDEEAS